jgi:hypothetical protein
LERYRDEECIGRGLQAKKVTKNLRKCRKIEGHEFGGKIDCANFR